MKLPSFFFFITIPILLLGAVVLWVGKPNISPSSVKEIDFFKGVSLSMNASEGDLNEAHAMGANIINFVVNIHPQQEGNWQFEGYRSGGAGTWQEHMASKIASAHQRELLVALSPFISFNNGAKDPQKLLDRMKPLYQELGRFAQTNSVHLVFVPGEVELVTGSSCCSREPKADMAPTANNELSSDGFVYWSKRISHELSRELRKEFDGHIAAEYIAGNWWYEGGRLVGIPMWDMSGFFAFKGGIAADEPKFDSSPAEVSYEHATELREIAQKSGVEKVLFSGPLVNSLRRNSGQDFLMDEEKRAAHYETFFEQTHSLVDGYFIPKFPPPMYDPVLFKVAGDWFARL